LVNVNFFVKIFSRFFELLFEKENSQLTSTEIIFNWSQPQSIKINYFYDIDDHIFLPTFFINVSWKILPIKIDRKHS